MSSSFEISPVQLIEKKRDGHELGEGEIEAFVRGITAGTMQDAQIGAMLMAIFIRGLSDSEVAHLTRCMTRSGHVFQWPAGYTLVDKHSTGGVGDKVSLPLAPLLAAAGLKVPMISGRGLGHTGGTLDKLESIPGYGTQLTPSQMQHIVQTVGCVITGATEDLVVADRILYSVRDVTGTVRCDGLVLSSIVSKKAAENISCLLMDLKVGTAGHYRNAEEGKKAAAKFKWLCGSVGMECVCVLSRMDAPLGLTVGNSLEVRESLDYLKGRPRCPKLAQLIQAQAAQLLVTLKRFETLTEAEDFLLRECLNNRAALSKFREMLIACGVTEHVATKLCSSEPDCYSFLPTAKFQLPVKSPEDGVVGGIDAMAVGLASNAMGAGRVTSSDAVNHAVGVEIKKTLGEPVKKGDVLAVVHCDHADESKQELFVSRILDAFRITTESAAGSAGKQHPVILII